jgi:hypothetical protein
MAALAAGWMLVAMLQQGAAPAPPPCPEARQAEVAFWVGDWVVSDTKSSTPVAESRIERVVDGCALRESFSQTVGPGNATIHYLGTSLTAWDASVGKWRQFYVDSAGHAAVMAGPAADGRLEMVNETNGGHARMIVERQADGTVRQRGESRASLDGEWTPGYDFTYARKRGSAAGP